MTKLLRSIGCNATTFLLLIAFPLSSFAQTTNHAFSITFAESASNKPITGRVFLAISRDAQPEPRFETGSYFKSIPFWAKDVDQLEPGKDVIIDTNVIGYPVSNLRDLPAGDYYIQAIMNVYTQYHRADGHTIWAHQDQWDGQRWAYSPGNLLSTPVKVHIDPAQGFRVQLTFDHKLPPIDEPKDTKWVKHIKIQSDTLTKWWGVAQQLG